LAQTTNMGQTRTIEEAVAYAVGHRIRIEALSILNEGTASPNEIAKLIDEGVSKVGHHIKELAESGCIELVGTAQRRGATEHFYRAVERPFISDEEARELPPEAKREFAALILQAIMAEGLSALGNAKMDDDDDIWLSWRSIELDAEGRRELSALQAETYARIEEIEARSTSRLVELGEQGKSTVVVGMAFERSRKGRPIGNSLASSPDLASTSG
jgi:DNA-binding transcriptional ArsR family regulator